MRKRERCSSTKIEKSKKAKWHIHFLINSTIHIYDTRQNGPSSLTMHGTPSSLYGAFLKDNIKDLGLGQYLIMRFTLNEFGKHSIFGSWDLSTCKTRWGSINYSQSSFHPFHI